MYDQLKNLFSRGEIEDKLYDCVLAIGNAIQMDCSYPRFVFNQVQVDDLDLSDVNEQYRATRNFVTKFLDEVCNIDNEFPNHIPSMEFVMRLISSTGLGAKAFGFIDSDGRIEDAEGNILSGIDAAKHLVSNIDMDDRYVKIADLFDIKIEDIKNTLEGEGTYIALKEFIKRPVTAVLEFTLLIGMPIQALFGYQFYSFCDQL